VAHGEIDTAAPKKTKLFLFRPGSCVCRWHAAVPVASVPSVLWAGNVKGSLAWLAVLLMVAPSASAQELQAVVPPPADPGEPHADRVVLAPTAYTHPRGTFFVSSYDVVVLQAGYALTDRTQLSLTVTPPLGEPGEVRMALLDLTLKTALVREGLVRVAALGSVSGLATNDPGVLLVGRAGGVVQFCFRPECSSSVSLSSNVLLLGPVVLMANGVGAILRGGRHVSFVLEVDTVIPLGREAGAAHAILSGGGVRLHFQHFAADLSVLGGSAPVPVLALTWRR
jgi:hypothetical protein